MVRQSRAVPLPVLPVAPSVQLSEILVEDDENEEDDQLSTVSEYVQLEGDDVSSVAIGLDSPSANPTAVPGLNSAMSSMALAMDVVLSPSFIPSNSATVVGNPSGNLSTGNPSGNPTLSTTSVVNPSLSTTSVVNPASVVLSAAPATLSAPPLISNVGAGSMDMMFAQYQLYIN